MSGLSFITKIRLIVAAGLIAMSFSSAFAQKVVVKSNLLSDATLSPNAGVEFAVAPKWTIDVSGQINLWTVNGRKWRHWLFQPEGRYWFCNTFSGHFVGAHLLGGQYNMGNINMPFTILGTDFSVLKHTRAQGWYAGAGIAYGYDWIINRRWTIEAEIGFGWVYTRFDRYPCANCGRKIDNNRVHNYVGPTKAAINIVYAF